MYRCFSNKFIFQTINFSVFQRPFQNQVFRGSVKIIGKLVFICPSSRHESDFFLQLLWNCN